MRRPKSVVVDHHCRSGGCVPHIERHPAAGGEVEELCAAVRVAERDWTCALYPYAQDLDFWRSRSGQDGDAVLTFF